MIKRLQLSLSIVFCLLTGAPTMAFNVDTALAPAAGQNMHNQLTEPVATPGLVWRTADAPARINSLSGSQPSPSIGLQQYTPHGLFLMFNLPATELGKASSASRPFYFDIYSTAVMAGKSHANPGIFTGWVECEVCRSIFELEYEKFFNCDEQLFFGWC